MDKAKSPKKSQHKRKGVAIDPALRGRGPAKGAANAGRPPDAWLAQLREIRDRFLQAAIARGIADDPDHPMWAKVGTWAHEHLEGRPQQKMDVTSNGQTLEALLAASHKPPTD